MRSVTFVSRLSLNISGDVAQHGLCLGDVTGDGDHELVVGTDGGDLLVFKGAGAQVWRRGQDMGFITAVGMGDLLNIGHTVVVVVSGCGWLNILDLHNDTDIETIDVEIKPIHTQRIPANVKDVIIGDINGDGSTELIISLTDRVVRTYKWVSSLPLGDLGGPGDEAQCGRLVSVNKWEFASQIGTVTLNHDTDGSP